MKKEIKILISVDGKIFPFFICHEPSKKFLKICESTDDGLVGEFLFQTIKETKQAASNCMKNMTEDTDEADQKMKQILKYGFKIKVVKEEDGHELYQIIDDPLKDDGCNPAY